MKYLAILKDSLREAIDTKVFYVMVGLSVVLTLVTFTLSFKPQPADPKFMEFMAIPLMVDDMEDVNFERIARQMQAPGFKVYEVKAVEPLDGSSGGPDTAYRVLLVAHSKTDAEARKQRDNPAETLERIKQRFGVFDELRAFQVTDVGLTPANSPNLPEAPSAKDVYFEVTVQPTSVARRLWPHEPSLFFGALPLSFLGELPLGLQLYLLEDTIVNGFGAWIAVLISVIITAFFIPNMLRKGTVDLLLVKPIHRTTLLLYKYAGGLIFILLNTAVAVGGVWLALGLRSGVWAPSFLLTVLVITAFFAILYAVSTLFAVLTRSPVVAILLTCGVWFILYIVGVLYQFGETLRITEERRAVAVQKGKDPDEVPDPFGRPPPEPAENGAKDKAGGAGTEKGKGSRRELPFRSDNWFFNTVRAVHYVLPRTKDLDVLMSQVLIRDLLTANQVKARKIDESRISWGESLTVSGIFIAVMLGAACWWFATKDY